ncbi:hypothetical protein [Edaphobacter aggregans]|uniref:hypothetical protein n=1 Tax=Edaphobacter aggregans TaxID=570835 RepID=UPI00069230DF|nr:hypothetical protein [Edaphobacter aggregans]
MPLIEVTQTRRVTANVRFDDAIVMQINQYAAFIGATPDEVINKGLEYLFEKDREFAVFKSSDQSKNVPQLLRPRGTGNSVPSKTPPKKPSVGVEPNEAVAVRRA